MNPSPDGQGHGTKLGKNRSRSRIRTTPRKDRFEPMETKVTKDETPHQDKIQSQKKSTLQIPPHKVKHGSIRENQIQFL